MTLSLAAVFIPVLFMSGIMGRLFHEFAVDHQRGDSDLGLRLAQSHADAVQPLSQAARRDTRMPFSGPVEKVFDGMRDLYGWTLRGVLRHRFLTMLMAAGTLAATIYLYGLVPKGFIPNQDTGQIQAVHRSPAGHLLRCHGAAPAGGGRRSSPKIPTSTRSSSSVGGGGGGVSGRQCRPRCICPPEAARVQRKLRRSRSSNDLRPKLNAIPGIRTYLQNPPLVRIGGQQVTRSLYQYTLQAPGSGRALPRRRRFRKAHARPCPACTDVNSDLQISSPQVIVDIDRDRASALGLTADTDRERALTMLTVRGRFPSIYTSYQRLPGDPGTAAANTSWTRTCCNLLYVTLEQRQAGCRWARWPSLRTGVAPLTVAHLGQLPSVTISFNLQPGVSLGEAVDRCSRPPSNPCRTPCGPAFRALRRRIQSSLGGMGMLLAMAILVIYMVLGILYESFIHPITILSGLPSAGLGALVTLLIFHDELNIYSFVGIIMLIGIVKKNAIMMIDFALEAQRMHNMAPDEAIYEACLVRFRPIMMTTMAALMGTLPIALGFGAGAKHAARWVSRW